MTASSNSYDTATKRLERALFHAIDTVIGHLGHPHAQVFVKLAAGDASAVTVCLPAHVKPSAVHEIHCKLRMVCSEHWVSSIVQIVVMPT